MDHRHYDRSNILSYDHAVHHHGLGPSLESKQLTGQSGEVSSFDSGYQRSHESAPYNSLEQRTVDPNLVNSERLTPVGGSYLSRADSTRSIYSYTSMVMPPQSERCWSPLHQMALPPRSHHSFAAESHVSSISSWPAEYHWQLAQHQQVVQQNQASSSLVNDQDYILPVVLSPSNYVNVWQQAAGQLRTQDQQDPSRVIVISTDDDDDAGVVADHRFLGPVQPPVAMTSLAPHQLTPLPQSICPTTTVQSHEIMPATTTIAHERSTSEDDDVILVSYKPAPLPTTPPESRSPSVSPAMSLISISPTSLSSVSMSPPVGLLPRTPSGTPPRTPCQTPPRSPPPFLPAQKSAKKRAGVVNDPIRRALPPKQIRVKTETASSEEDDVIFVGRIPAPTKSERTKPAREKVKNVAELLALQVRYQNLKRAPVGSDGRALLPPKKKKPNNHEPTSHGTVTTQAKKQQQYEAAIKKKLVRDKARVTSHSSSKSHHNSSGLTSKQIAFFPNPDFHAKYSVLNEIGKGGGGTVYAGKRKSDGLDVAVKKVDMKTVKRWSAIKGQTVPIEFALYKKAANNNKGVVQQLDWFEHKKKYVLVMERQKACMDLFDLMNCKGPLPEKAAKKIFRQVVEAVQLCHKNGVVHRDIKDENVLVNPETYDARIIDFGCAARLKTSDYLEFAGTPEFYPPEWFKNRRYNGRILDTWSLGVLLYTMIESEVPFRDKNDIVKCNLVFKRSHAHASRDCHRFIRDMLNIDESKRIRLEDIPSHPWMTKE